MTSSSSLSPTGQFQLPPFYRRRCHLFLVPPALHRSISRDRTGKENFSVLDGRRKFIEGAVIESDLVDSSSALELEFHRLRIHAKLLAFCEDFSFFRSATAAMRGSLFNRRTMQRFRQVAISTVGSLKIKLLLCFCIGLTLIALASRAPGLLGWTGQSVSDPPLADSRFVKLFLMLELMIAFS